MPKSKGLIFIAMVFACCLQWVLIKNLGIHIASPWNAIAPGIAIFGAAFILSWGAELAQFEIPQSLAIAFLAMVAVLPEYAVDMYFAWEAGKNPEYIHFATANMTGANRLLIGVGWAAVVIAYFLKTKKKAIFLEPANRVEILALMLATVYSFIIPFKKSLSGFDSIMFVAIFVWYMFQVIRSHHEEPEIEEPIVELAALDRIPRALVILFFFFFAGYSIFIAAEPFAEALLENGRHLGIEEFILVQWIAPLASESPEFIIAILFALRAKAHLGLSTLISSKVNQWTLLIGFLPIVYALSAGSLAPMPLDARQSEEIFLTAAQSLFALVILLNLRFTIVEAFFLLVLFITQLFFTSTEIRFIYAFFYLTLSLIWFMVQKDNWAALKQVLETSYTHPRHLKK